MNETRLHFEQMSVIDIDDDISLKRYHTTFFSNGEMLYRRKGTYVGGTEVPV